MAPPNLYDCKSAGLWSPLQAKYCCRVHGLGCTGEKSPHDCGGESTGTDWDYYCCAKASRGCKPNDAPTGPYECYDGMYRVETLPVLKLSVPERVAEWCCSFRGLGCKQRDYCVVQFEISSDDAVREACCSSTGLGCKYTCSEGVQWTADEEAYCCRTGGSQCNAQDLSEAVAAQEALLKTLPHAVVEAKIRANWNEIAQKPKLFARKVPSYHHHPFVPSHPYLLHIHAGCLHPPFPAECNVQWCLRRRKRNGSNHGVFKYPFFLSRHFSTTIHPLPHPPTHRRLGL